MQITPEWIKLAFQAIQVIWMIGVSVYLFFTRRHLANKSAIEDLGERTDERFHTLSDRVLRVENEIEHLPGTQELGLIHEKINLVTKEVSEMRGEFTAVRHSLQLIQRHLLGKGA